MHDTAERLERVEARMHRSAEESPDLLTTARLHARADAVTAEAKKIDDRADHMDETEPAS